MIPSRRPPAPAPALALLALLGLAAGAFLPFARPAAAQWPDDPAVNVAIADRPADQVVPLVATAPDGTTWVAWFDAASGNFDVYLQLLDPSGVEQWPHGGLLISGHPQNSAIFGRWGLVADSAGGAVLAFADERDGSDLDVQAYRVARDGTMLWGPDGVTLSDNPDFEPGARVVEASDGDFVFAWQRSGSGSGDLRMQRLSPDGVPRLPAGGVPVVAVPGEQPGFVEMVAGLAGGVVLSWVRDTTSFASPRHVRVQGFDAAGAPEWPAVTVYDDFPVPIGYWPGLVGDGAGGAISCWHRSDGAAYNAFVQHVDAAGTELFPHQGVAVSTVLDMFHVDPSLARDPANGDLYVFWNERNLGQSAWGISGQRLSAAGDRLWGDAGAVLLPVDATYESYPRTVAVAGGAEVFLARDAGGGDELVALRVDESGALGWGGAPVVVSSVPSTKARYPVTVDAADVARVVWEDDRSGSVDVYGQALSPDGTLGVAEAAPCLYRADVTSLFPHVPARSAVYQPPGAGGVALQGAPLLCPFASGDLDPDPAAAGNGVPLRLYQVDVDGDALRVAREASRIRLTY